MAGVYISYPFCAQKCTYCNFASGVSPASLETEYRDALIGDLVAYRWPWRPETVYLGGGTPSRIEPHDLKLMLAAIPGRPWHEATMEAAPGGITRELVDGWKRAGITRVSLGVQSFVRRELARTGRKHTAEIVADEIGTLREAGLSNINIDLIAGLPGQTRDSWAESLGWIERLAPPHVSVYMLEVDQDSRLGSEVLLNGQRYGAPEIPSDGAIAEMYETAVRELARIGIERYEISNFARAGFESLHNLKYWRLEPYLGFGADAHSFDSRMRGQNVESAQEYVDRLREGRSPESESVPARRDEERFFVGLRLAQGLLLEPGEQARFEQPISRFIREGLLSLDHEMLRLTDRGVLFSNEVLAEFIES
jgi:oxygen-independent coproporphyrinogen III oxidase